MIGTFKCSARTIRFNVSLLLDKWMGQKEESFKISFLSSTTLLAGANANGVPDVWILIWIRVLEIGFLFHSLLISRWDKQIFQTVSMHLWRKSPRYFYRPSFVYTAFYKRTKKHPVCLTILCQSIFTGGRYFGRF